MGMRVAMSYGRRGLDVDLADGWDVTVIRKRPMAVLEDPGTAVRRALDEPVEGRPLAEAARGRRRACILICDITRPVPNGLVLPAVIRTMLAAGIRARDITVLIATGLHRPSEGQELSEVVGSEWVLRTVDVQNHFARNDADHTHLGQTSAGIPVSIDRRFVEADLRLVVGLVEPHFMAGYSGGRKLILPGVAHAQTITAFHRAGLLAHPRAANCVLEGNPLHQQQMEVVQMVGGALAVNTVLDEQRRLALVNFGEIAQSHLAAVRFVHEHAMVAAPRRFRTILTSGGGYPLDKTFYQTVKGMVAALGVLEPGGQIIIVSECSEGMGSGDYVDAQRRMLALGAQRFLEEATGRDRAAVDEWQTQMQLKVAATGQIRLYSTGLGREDWPLTGVTRVTDVTGAIEASVRRAGEAAIGVIPEGPYVVPVAGGG